jgi:hypothetical protein
LAWSDSLLKWGLFRHEAEGDRMKAMMKTILEKGKLNAWHKRQQAQHNAHYK